MNHYYDEQNNIDAEKASEAHDVELAAKIAIRSTVETVCWNCNTKIIRKQCKIDYPYLSICPSPMCGKSLREESNLGEGMPFDMAVSGNYKKYKAYKSTGV